MNHQDDIQKELAALSPLLAKLKARTPKPEVPEHYFHALPNQLWEQIKLQPAPERANPRRSAWAKLRQNLTIAWQPRVAIAWATFLLLLLAGMWFLQPGTSPVSNEGDLTAEEITHYIQNNLHEFDTELLIKATADLPSSSVFSTETFDETEVDQLMEEIIKDLDEETLEEML